MEKCESCQRKDMSFEKVNAEPDPDEEGLWEKKSLKPKLSPFNSLNFHLSSKYWITIVLLSFLLNPETSFFYQKIDKHQQNSITDELFAEQIQVWL